MKDEQPGIRELFDIEVEKLKRKLAKDDELELAGIRGEPYWGVGKEPVEPDQIRGIAEYLPAPRPPIERYLRCSVTFGCWTIEPGLEYRADDRLAPLLSQLQLVIGEAWKATAPWSIDDVPKLNETVERLVGERWPDRAWFLEVHHDIAGWTQIYQPYGVPRWR